MHRNISIVIAYSSVLPIISLYTDGTIKSILLYLHALGISSILYILINDTSIEEASTDRKDEIYGLKHLLFNLELPPKTLWFNMGLWDKPNLTFPEACENLVHAVAKAANVKTRSSVLDVGFGCGDSCLVLAEYYHTIVTGITNELSQYKIASDRVSSKSNISLIHGSADDLGKHIPITELYDSIISIDSAYHYNTRWDFLKTSLSHLKPNGTIGLYDLCIDPKFMKTPTSMQYKIFQFICEAVHIPIQNLVTVEEYESQLKSLGYGEIVIKSLERSEVFGGLSRSFDAQYATVMKYGIGVSLPNRVFLKVSNYFFGLLATKPWLVPVIVSGEKQD